MGSKLPLSLAKRNEVLSANPNKLRAPKATVSFIRLLDGDMA
jgi:hypothetical protein